MRIGRKLGISLVALAAGATSLLAVSGPADAATSAAPNCTSVKSAYVGNGWYLNSPGYNATHGSSFNCYLELGDRNNAAVKWLQYNIWYCYGEPYGDIVRDGYYGPQTKNYVQDLQANFNVPATGIYGPKTRSAISWRLYNPKLKVWSENCYSPV
jgi:peptidoglycan hydrolase-like protein with peptidoglycan-binding domain